MSSYRSVFKTLGTGFALIMLAGGAGAQYQWKDENGRMVFSDQGPPSHIDPSRVIRTVPGRTASGANHAVNTAPPAVSAAAENLPNPGARESLADKELDAKRKAKEKADAERKKKEEADQTAKLARACEEMRAELRTLESGMRAATVNAQGEREFLSDADRERRLDGVRRDIKDSCKPG